MNKELIRDYLEHSGMEATQAEALLRIFDEMATKSDVRLLEERIDRKLESLKVN